MTSVEPIQHSVDQNRTELTALPPPDSGGSNLWPRIVNHFERWGVVWIAWLASRIGVTLVGLLSEYAARSPERGITRYVPFFESGTFPHYISVVQNGYTLQNATEYPLFPLLLVPFDYAGIPLGVASVAISTICFLPAILMFAMIGERFFSHEAAVRSATLLAIFPTAHYFSIASTESVMLLTMCAATLLALRGTATSWLLAGVAAALCTLSRPPGMLIGLALLGIAIAQLRRGELRGRAIACAIAAGAMIPAAVVAFFSYLSYATGDFLASTHAQEEFNRSLSLTGPITAVTDGLRSVVGGELGIAFELLATAALIASAIWFYRTANGDRWEVRGWTLFAAAAILMPMATGIVWQMPRFALLILPAFWVLGTLTRRPVLYGALLILLPMGLTVKVVFDVIGVTR